MKREEIWLVDFNKNDKTSSIQLGVRPVIIVSNDLACKYSPVVTVIPLSSNISKAKLPTHVVMTERDGVIKPSFAMAEQVTSIDKKDMIKQLCKCTPHTMKRIENALLIQLGLHDMAINRGVC